MAQSLQKRFEHQWPTFKWIDIQGPDQKDLAALAEEFALPADTLINCLDPEHLPHAEFFGEQCFFVLRLYDHTAKESACSMQALTTKLVFFVGQGFVLTIHRAVIPILEEKKARCHSQNFSVDEFVERLSLLVVKSFDAQLDQLEHKTEVIEERVFGLHRRNILREGYNIKRKSSSFRKVFKFTADVLTKLQNRPLSPVKDLSDAKEATDRLIFYTENIYEEITGLLNLHLSLMSQKTNEASFKTNEVMRLLTVVSIIFLPLNFLAGVYGMNFENLPGLKNQYGYDIVLGVMVLITITLLGWAYSKSWLKKEDFY